MRKTSRLFYNYFVPILILSVAIVISFGSYIYISTTNSVISRFTANQQDLITQIRNTLEQRVQNIEYAFQTYSTTRSFTEVINSPLTEQDFNRYRELNSQLSYIATMGLEDVGVQYSFVSLVQKWSLSNGIITRMTQEDFDQLVEDYVRQDASVDRDLIWMKTDGGIRLVHKLPVHSQKKEALALTDISSETLKGILQTQPNNDVYILNRDGELLYTSSDSNQRALTASDLEQVQEQTHFGPETGQLSIQSEHEKPVRVLYAKSTYNNWKFATTVNENEIKNVLKTTQYGLIAMGAALMALMVIITYYLSLHLAKPIRKIQRSLPKSEGQAPGNEVDWIVQSINTIVTEKESLEDLIEAEKPKLETQFIQNLLFNRLTREEVERSMERFGYQIGMDTRFVTLLIQLDSYGKQQVSDQDVLLLALNNRVQEMLQPSIRLLPVVFDQQTQATILLFQGDSDQEMRKQVLHYGKQIIKSARDYLGFSISIGVSSLYADLMESKSACEMSLEALYRRLNLGKESIIFFDDISDETVSNLLQYPTELELRLFDAIRLGDEQAVSSTLYPLLAEMMKLSKNPMNLEVILIRFVNNLIQLEQMIGGDILLSQHNSQLYRRLLATRNPEEIERMLIQEVIHPLVRSVKEKTTYQYRSIADKMAAIVHTEYDQDLSLELISDRLHYSPNYLSSIFKKEYETNFSEYLMNYRLDIAMRWLETTDMPIKDIGERLRYQNSQNFIRSFRKREEMTPGAYRKLKQSR